jgi:hypothetical protein
MGLGLQRAVGVAAPWCTATSASRSGWRATMSSKKAPMVCSISAGLVAPWA